MFLKNKTFTIYSLIAIIQLMSASEAGRPLIYTTLNDVDFSRQFKKVHSFFQQENGTVGDLHASLVYFLNHGKDTSLFDLILKTNFQRLCRS